PQRGFAPLTPGLARETGGALAVFGWVAGVVGPGWFGVACLRLFRPFQGHMKNLGPSRERAPLTAPEPSCRPINGRSDGDTGRRPGVCRAARDPRGPVPESHGRVVGMASRRTREHTARSTPPPRALARERRGRWERRGRRAWSRSATRHTANAGVQRLPEAAGANARTEAGAAAARERAQVWKRSRHEKRQQVRPRAQTQPNPHPRSDARTSGRETRTHASTTRTSRGGGAEGRGCSGGGTRCQWRCPGADGGSAATAAASGRAAGLRHSPPHRDRSNPHPRKSPAHK
ncbi:hypothetical protein HNR73_000674, partial [Phytomonospora endophytica]|nr:hypothetical protein [Phytomonospora endophytica]